MGPPSTPQLAFRSIVGRSEAIEEVIAIAHKVARSPVRMVLLDGETGTGKELFARGIHYASARAAEPFAAVNCAAIPASLMESELFGHERGAFTDATAQKKGLLELTGAGTVLLDEVAELALPLQAKLLRVLEDRKARRVGGVEEIEIKCRVIAASNVNLEDAVTRGAFREDLFYRLNAFRITLPALRDRGADIELLARHFLRELAVEQNAPVKSLNSEAIALLYVHDWRGNVRELKNVVERAAVLADGSEIRPEHIVLQRRSPMRGEARKGEMAGEIQVPWGGRKMEDIEREAIRITLTITDGNQTRAAKILGISRPTLIRKLQKYGLTQNSSDALTA